MFGLGKKKKCATQIELEQMRQDQPRSNTNTTWSQANNTNTGTGRFSMVVEDAFTITGRGTVLTGKVDGQIAVGNTVNLNGKTYAVQGIEVFRKTMQSAQTGDTIGLLLRGLDKRAVQRGDIVTR